jgi:3-oxoacyl-[acyl-carrier-protein] synthase II
MGVICPVGNTVQEAWENAAAGKTGISRITLFDPSLVDTNIAGEVKGFDPVEVLGRRDARRTDRVTQFAVYVSKQAFDDSGLEVTEENRYEIGCLIGTGIGGISSLLEAIDEFHTKGHRGVSPLAVPRILSDSSSGKVSMHFGLRGPNFSIATACATGNNCIGEAAEIIRRGQAKIMLAGSTEAAVVPVTMASFNNMTALSRRIDEPEKASRPFDIDRDGFVTAEGAAVLVLEELEHAKARAAKIYAEFLGYGHTSDAYHVTAPLENGEGAAEAMKFALENARLNPEDLGYINAHGTSTPLNDKSETLAMKRALGEVAYEIPVSSTKSVTGHMLGAAGSVEAVFSIMAMCNNFIPPTINLDNPDPECDLFYTPNVGIEREVNAVMSNSFGFGGHNAVVIFGKYNGRA